MVINLVNRTFYFVSVTNFPSLATCSVLNFCVLHPAKMEVFIFVRDRRRNADKSGINWGFRRCSVSLSPTTISAGRKKQKQIKLTKSTICLSIPLTYHKICTFFTSYWLRTDHKNGNLHMKRNAFAFAEPCGTAESQRHIKMRILFHFNLSLPSLSSSLNLLILFF